MVQSPNQTVKQTFSHKFLCSCTLLLWFLLFVVVFVVVVHTNASKDTYSAVGYDICLIFRFTVYKLPEIHEIGIDPLSYDGVGFYYMDAVTPSWKLSSVGINDTGHSVEYTLRQIYKNVSLKMCLINL